MRQWRIEYDREVMQRLQPYHSDINVLAGYMLIVGEEMCTKYDLINLHPAAPDGPAGTWQEVIWKLIETKAAQSGVMIHLVTKDLDQGPPLTYCMFSLRDSSADLLWEKHEEKLRSKSLHQIIEEEGTHNEIFQEIRKRGVQRELPLIVYTLQALAEGKIRIEKGKAAVESRGQHRPFCLTEQIEAIIKDRNQ